MKTSAFRNGFLTLTLTCGTLAVGMMAGCAGSVDDGAGAEGVTASSEDALVIPPANYRVCKTTSGVTTCYGNACFAKTASCKVNGRKATCTCTGIGPAAEYTPAFSTTKVTCPGGTFVQCDETTNPALCSCVANPAPALDPMEARRRPIKVVAGEASTYALYDDGSVFVWGLNKGHELGIATPGVLGIGTPTELKFFAKKADGTNTTTRVKVKSISAAEHGACAIIDDAQRTVQCWGTVVEGAFVGLVEPAPARIMAQLTQDADPVPLTNVAAVSQTSTHACARTTQGKIFCWGTNDQFQIGSWVNDGVTKHGDSAIAKPILGVEDAVDVVVGGRTTAGNAGTTCYRRRAGTVYCFGSNDNGQTGVGDAPCTVPFAWPPVQHHLSTVNGDETVAYGLFGGGRGSFCMNRPDGAECWGYNFNGELGIVENDKLLVSVTPQDSCNDTGTGNGNTEQHLIISPEPVNHGTGAAHVFGTKAACAYRPFSRMTCWGDNTKGVAYPTTPGSIPRVPTTFSGLKSVESVAIGGEHACAIGDDGVLLCWGENQYGRLASGMIDSGIKKPVRVTVPRPPAP